MAERPSLGRDDSYNRVTVSRDLKSQIMSMIADSSESLPLNTVDESEEDETADKSKTTTAATNGAGSKLATESMSANDFATPKAEKPNPLEKSNPLEQVPTVRVDSSLAPKDASAAPSDFETASPMRSHDPEGPELGKLGKRISKMVTHSETDVADGKAKDSDGASASRATTASGTPSRPGMDKRQSTMKRISSAFKRTVSKNQ